MPTTVLKNILQYTNVPNGNMVSLAHGLNFNGAGRVPDVVLPDHGGWSFTINATNVEATNNTGGLDSIDVYVEAWHTEQRALPAGIVNLTPRPFVPNFASSASVPDPYTPPDGTWNVNGGIQITQPAQDAANPIISGLNVIGGAHTDIPDNAASFTTDLLLVDNTTRTVNFVGGGAGTIAYAPNLVGDLVSPITLTADAAHTVSIAATLAIGGAPTAGANVTITEPLSLLVTGNAGVGELRPVPTLGVNTLTLRGMLPAGDAGVDVTVNSLNTRTNGRLFSVQNAAITKAAFDWTGRLEISSHTETGSIVGGLEGGRLDVLGATINDATNISHTSTRLLGNSINYADATALGLLAHHTISPGTTLTGDVATKTISVAATFNITGAPTAGANVSITDSYALRVASGESFFGGPVNITPADPAGGSPSAVVITLANTDLANADINGEAITVPPYTTNFLGGGGAFSYSGVTIGAATLTADAAQTLSSAAGLTVAPPVQSTNMTLNQIYSIHAEGVMRIDAARALGGGAAPTFGTIGGTGPTAAAQNEWIEIHTGNGVRFVPAWA